MIQTGGISDAEIPTGDASEEELRELGNIISNCRTDTYSKGVWDNNARHYLKWWVVEKQDVKRRAGKVRAAKAEAKKN
jgi:hypothetical protein